MKLIKSIKLSLLALLMMAGFAAVPLVAGDQASAAPKDQILRGANAADPGTSPNLDTTVGNVVNILLFIIGIIAVIVIIIGGIMYVTSAGDPSKAKRAKDTILYAVVGLAVAILAYAIVEFVVRALYNSP